ncbi:MAG: antibiotic biosynthesis monooxygenase family protein [Candidatus Geothermincolia bacterium]
MYARVLRFTVDPKRIEEGIEVYTDGYVPEAKQQKGFLEAMLLGDRETGKGMTLSIWESEADAKATEQSGFLQQVIAKFAGFFTEAPTIEGFEIMVRDLANVAEMQAILVEHK